MRSYPIALAAVLLFSQLLSAAPPANLVIIPPPQSAESVPQGFELYACFDDVWVGGIIDIKSLPQDARVLESFRADAGDLYMFLLTDPGEAAKLPATIRMIYSGRDKALLQLKTDDLPTLPPLRVQWVKITLTPKRLPFYSGTLPPTDDFSPFVPEMVAQVSQTHYLSYLQTLQDFDTRNSNTANCDSAAFWILSTMQGFGLNATLDAFPLNNHTKYNVIGELTGTLYPDSIVLITAHYDATIGQPGSPEPIAPGADDNASGTACVLECARILSIYSFEKTVRFVAFCGEEQGLVGSIHYVTELALAGAHVAGSFNFDMIAATEGSPPYGLRISPDNNPLSQAMAYKLVEAANTFTPGIIQPNYMVTPGSASSDHYPFWVFGYPATFTIHTANYPYYHTLGDTIGNCDVPWAVNVTKIALASLADWAEPISGITEISGSISGTLTPLHNPYMVVDTLYIPQDSSLTIEAGVNLLFDGRYPFQIRQNARLQVLGTVLQPVTLTAFNQAEGWGGLRFSNSADECQLTHCVIKYAKPDAAQGDSLGGGVSLDGVNAGLENVLIFNCEAVKGGAVACLNGSSALIRNCTFADNQADFGSALYSRNSSPQVNSSIFWNDGWTETYLEGSGSPSVEFSDVRGGWSGTGNLDADPQFVNSATSNFHLQSVVGSYAYGVWQQDPQYSPCIDAGDPSASYANEPEPNGDRMDMGIYGNTDQASLSLHDPHYAFGEASGIWTQANNPMNVIGNLIVPPGETLTIEAGLNVIFQGLWRLDVLEGATLNAEGAWADSIIFTRANAPDGWGGINFNKASPNCHLSYCRFDYATKTMGGVINSGGTINADSTDFTIEHCSFNHSSATNGGAIYTEDSAMEIISCNFEADSAGSGGAIYLKYSSATIRACRIDNCTATSAGGIYYWMSSGDLENCVITDNTAVGFAGGVYCLNSPVELGNNTIVENTATTSGGLHSVGTSVPQIINSIFWDNVPSQLNAGGSVPQVTYSDIAGGWVGEGNTDADPQFSTGAFGAYELGAGSPCVDTGNPNPLYNDPEDPANPGMALLPARGTLRNDMGAYGGSGAQSWVGVRPEPNSVSKPSVFRLEPCYPNPFNPITNFSFDLPRGSRVTLQIFDVAGRLVASPVQGSWRDTGTHRATFNASNLASGVYFYRLQAGDFTAIRKMVMLK